ncbi:hypothetical protein [Acetobacterium tundrae]|uniref:Uncharacterized protein n=1 Tax=Acetobacterium tundrae TaxID=132932 RepID=A0ABR6WPG5_9FIRM|nr:hypothetical protein [Acetobacterium tundrae]MBC3798390.1 hypothetical protein [Acetobacterium tundrae]
MNSKLEFDSEFCNVRYMESDNVVFLRWNRAISNTNITSRWIRKMTCS